MMSKMQSVSVSQGMTTKPLLLLSADVIMAWQRVSNTWATETGWTTKVYYRKAHRQGCGRRALILRPVAG